ncbi:hypothetical protein ACIBKX_15155 [Streptomyces sp. NPDC050658]|uniref:hypothetical protein n=1 Tax=unclassified Streptomyces TaxID=2593676 RepID=UPI003444425E
MTSTPTPELAAAQACLRLLHTARAALTGTVPSATAASLLAGPMAEADEALRRAGLTGNEAALLERIYDLDPGPGTEPGEDGFPSPGSAVSSSAST